jgi:DNA-binding NarL/FixJ family response regulator
MKSKTLCSLSSLEASAELKRSRMSVGRILVVDDFVPWRHLVLRLLESETDLQIISTAFDGTEAVQKAEELQPDLILMDLGLPGINGIEATRQIGIVSAGSKVLFLTHHSEPDIIQAAFDAGASGYVLKSDFHADLIPAVRAVLRGQKFVSRSLKN